jgi:signal transduction histidine kinase
VPPIVADRDRLMQVMLNLLSNAAKFCERPRGKVVVALARDGGFLRVDVTDNGVGISQADQDVIFDKFRQVGDTLTQKPKGSGLGLAISRQIIDHFGGRLWVRSRLGEGSTFSFTVPVESPRPARVPAVLPEPKFGT